MLQTQPVSVGCHWYITSRARELHWVSARWAWKVSVGAAFGSLVATSEEQRPPSGHIVKQLPHSFWTGSIHQLHVIFVCREKNTSLHLGLWCPSDSSPRNMIQLIHRLSGPHVTSTSTTVSVTLRDETQVFIELGLSLPWYEEHVGAILWFLATT